ncbi:MAG: flagellar basal body L-ring protein FlgH [Alphaproteobacteria bacterium]|nr:flagellar basal body L-ring protein FlgH [Alphaproteobacteria bacterium]MDX5367990.1 flagellar basal body L-ring protein FlgH [Alphaproteobacteria bacterium]MDX5462843.1 flagellar basal body L-ring protein FlgH [Alphaproteobacteria bacterium]
MKRALLLTLGMLTLSACADRLDHLGKPPSMTAPGAPRIAVPAPQPAVLPQQQAERVYPERAIARSQPTAGSLWRTATSDSLFSDHRARRVGDMLTVVIEIDDEAKIRNRTTRARSGSESVSVPNLLGIETLAPKVLPGGAGLAPAVDLGADSASSGDGAVTRNEEITLRIAATVTDVLPNGNLIIQGSQEVRVNYELRDLQIAGIVRPSDISRKNTITYDRIAEARIAYGGRGQIDDLQQPRYGQQVLDMILPF